ncbi:hypothetical protein B0T14DRAFT_156683 [Immersiella caudata]|uniref:Uncharacterized protein n=1 Tax=Immersiella caudata TaxID=314043 RepID=A0AA39WWN7_9PEZI|nr:hypothetical protein B0T14DRAFT_156683 [Immersiella caudata]
MTSFAARPYVLVNALLRAVWELLLVMPTRLARFRYQSSAPKKSPPFELGVGETAAVSSSRFGSPSTTPSFQASPCPARRPNPERVWMFLSCPARKPMVRRAQSPWMHSGRSASGVWSRLRFPLRRLSRIRQFTLASPGSLVDQIHMVTFGLFRVDEGTARGCDLRLAAWMVIPRSCNAVTGDGQRAL